MTYLVTGGCGFLGSNIARYLLEQNHRVIVFDNLSRIGSKDNLAFLKSLNKDLLFYEGNISVYEAIESVVKEHRPEVVFHFAAQVAMTTSIERPLDDFKTNALGAVHVLESVRLHVPKSIVCFSSTNKVYGDMIERTYDETPTRYRLVGDKQAFDETTPLNFQSPYGCSKGSADQYMLDYHRIYGLKTIVFRHSSIYGGRQYATKDQGWVGWFIDQAIRIQQGTLNAIEISGNGKQVRDLLFGDDLTACYMAAIKHIDTTAGQVYNIGGGYENSLSILELFQALEKMLHIQITIKQKPFRQSDQLIFIADNTKALNDFKWTPKVAKGIGLDKMLRWVTEIITKEESDFCAVVNSDSDL